MASSTTNVLFPINSATRERISQSEKDANDFQWYKDKARLLGAGNGISGFGFGGVSDLARMRVNYDLFNNIIDQKDFSYVCKPYGAEMGDLPARMTNRDIVSGKIKVLLGMEMKMPFSWKVVAVNREATTRREEKEFGMIRDFVESEIMRPLQMEIQQQIAAQTKGKELTPEEQQQLQQQIQEQTAAKTPDELKRYMEREHQDPAEMLSHQILEYLIQKERINDKFNKGWKHSNISGKEIYFQGIRRGEPVLTVVNPMLFECDDISDMDYIEDREWCRHEIRATRSQIIAWFGDELKEHEIDRIYDNSHTNAQSIMAEDFSFEDRGSTDQNTIRLMHYQWKALRKIGFLTYHSSDTNEEEMTIVDENYKINVHEGDIDIDWEYVPETHECYQILDDIFVHCRPVPGQSKDVDNLFSCKLSYYGAMVDNMNSPVTAPMDRMKAYQYFYDVIIYRIELLMASDKGKILAANIKSIPKSAGITTAQFMYFMEANKIAWFNPSEEGARGTNGDVGSLGKVLDMSLTSQIAQYIQMAEYIEKKCGDSIGVNHQMEGAIGPNEAVTNTRQNIMQSSHIIQPYFELHNIVKANVLQGLLETAKVAYSTGKPRKLSYILDDMSLRMIDLSAGNMALLDNSTLGLFVSNSSKADDAKKAVENLAQAAMQNQQADLVDIIKVIRSESVTEAEELLQTSMDKKQQQLQSIDQQKMKAEQDARIAAQAQEDREWAHEEKMIVVKEKERRKTELQKQAMLSMGFDPNKDEDGDGEIDVLEVYKAGTDAQIKAKKLELDSKKLDHQMSTDERKLDQNDTKLKIDAKKAAQKPASSK